MRNQYDTTYLNKKILSLENLVLAIEDLDARDIIYFDEFKELQYMEIKGRFFAMPNPVSMEKAIIKIEDKRSGKTGFSSLVRVTEKYINGELVQVKESTQYF